MSLILPGLAVTLLFGGLLLAACLSGAPAQRGDRLLLAGGALPLGVLTLGCLLWVQGDVPVADGLQRAALVALLLGALPASWTWWWRRRSAVQPPPATSPREFVPRSVAALAWLLLIAAALSVVVNAWSMPTLAWDAWNAWFAKAKAWYHVGRFLPVLELGVWMQSAPGEALTAIGAPYPESIPRWVAALAHLHGGWSDAVAAAAWPLLWASAGALLAAEVMRRGGGARLATCAAALLLSLPMMMTHASLAGYHDLWLGVTVLLAYLLGERWLGERRWSLLVGFALTLLLMLTVKTEGAVYALLLVVALMFGALSRRMRWALTGGGLVLLAIGLGHGIAVSLPLLGELRFDRGGFQLPLFGSFQLAWRPVGMTVLNSLFVLPNWSLLWYLAIPLLLAWPAWRRVGTLGISFAWLAFAFHAVLFLFTDAAAWASDLTSLNRLLLHVVPFWGLLLSLAVVPRPAPYGRATR